MLNDEIPVETARHIRTLFSARYWRRTAFNSLFFVCLVIPYFAIYTFLPPILATLGQSQNFATDLLLNGLLMAGALLGIVFTQWLPRRRFLIGSFWILAASLGALAFVPVGQGAMLLLFGLFTLTISAVSNLVGIFPAESFPTDIRSLGVGFATSMSRLGSAIGTGLLPLSMISLRLAGHYADPDRRAGVGGPGVDAVGAGDQGSDAGGRFFGQAAERPLTGCRDKPAIGDYDSTGLGSVDAARLAAASSACAWFCR